jgi:Uma2 family endonuclease
MDTLKRTYTAQDLLTLQEGEGRFELVEGALIPLSPSGEQHGVIVATLTVLLGHFILTHKLGRPYGAETGFLVATQPDTVRAPDFAFIRAERLKGTPGTGYRQDAPDLAVEVVSPGDTYSGMTEKALLWLGAGTREVWLLDPRKHTVSVYLSKEEIRVLTEDDALSSDLFPGWQVKVTELFGGL